MGSPFRVDPPRLFEGSWIPPPPVGCFGWLLGWQKKKASPSFGQLQTKRKQNKTTKTKNNKTQTKKQKQKTQQNVKKHVSIPVTMEYQFRFQLRFQFWFPGPLVPGSDPGPDQRPKGSWTDQRPNANATKKQNQQK